MFNYIRYIQSQDSAQPTFMEVLLAYNGVHALGIHRISHWIWENTPLRALPRFLSNVGRILTGVEIHPQARIGKYLYIDHGTGVVIGQTAIIGDNVTIFHGVTLGGVGREGEDGSKRHPTVEDGVMIGSGAQVLGDITIGARAKIGSNSVVTTDIPEGKTALGIPARVIGGDEKSRSYGLPSRKEMEEITFTIDCILKQMEEMRAELDKPKKKAARKKKAS